MSNTEVTQKDSAAAATVLAAEIKRLRRAAGWSQPQLADKIGYSRQYVSRAENGRGVPSHDLVRAIDTAIHANGHLLTLWATARTEQTARRRPRTTGPSPAQQRSLLDPDESGLPTPGGRYFSGSTIPAIVVPAHQSGGRILTDPADPALDRTFLARPQRGLVIAATGTGPATTYYGLDRRRARRLTTTSDLAPLVIPPAYVLDDFSLAILWAVTNLDEALLDDDTALTDATHQIRNATGRSATAAPDIADDLSPISQRWLGSGVCARHILHHTEQLTDTPAFWTREQRGEEASTWLLFTHKYHYLQRTAELFTTTSSAPTRAFCIPTDTVTTSDHPERILLLLTAALIESFGIPLTVCIEPEYTATPGFVLDDRHRAIIATWINTDRLWHTDITDHRAALTEFRDAAGWARAHTILPGPTPPQRLRQLADYLALDWTWITLRSRELADYGTTGLAATRSRLLSTAGLDRACAFLADLDHQQPG